MPSESEPPEETEGLVEGAASRTSNLEKSKCQCSVELGCWCWGAEVAQEVEPEESEFLNETGEEKWNALWDEFKWDNMWTQQKPNSLEREFRGWNSIGKTFCLAFFALLLSASDVGSDYLTFWSFLYGDNYTKTEPSVTNPYVTGDFNCTKTGQFYSFKTDNVTSYTFECWETNPVFAWVTVAFTLLPAINLSLALASRGPWWALLAILTFLIPFPIILLIVKSIALFNIGKEFDSVNHLVTEAEARWESSLQFCLQIFIVFTRGDRQPSTRQLFSIANSVIMMSKGSIGNFLANEEPLPLGQQIVRIGTMFPVHLTNLVFKLGSLSITCALLSFNAIWLYLLLGLVWVVLWLHPDTRHYTKSVGSHVLGLPNTATPDVNFVSCARRELCDWCSKRNLLVWNIIWLVVNGALLLSLTITANLWPTFPIPIFFPFPDAALERVFPDATHQLASFRGAAGRSGELRLADLPIVQEIYILNCSVATVIAFGVVSVYLIYWQLVLEYQGLQDANKWTEVEKQTVDVGTNTENVPGWRKHGGGSLEE